MMSDSIPDSQTLWPANKQRERAGVDAIELDLGICSGWFLHWTTMNKLLLLYSSMTERSLFFSNCWQTSNRRFQLEGKYLAMLEASSSSPWLAVVVDGGKRVTVAAVKISNEIPCITMQNYLCTWRGSPTTCQFEEWCSWCVCRTWNAS